MLDTSLAPLIAIPPAVSTAIAARAQLRDYADGEQVFDQDDEATACYAVVTGSVRFSKRLDNGEFVLMSFQNPSTWFGETSLLDGKPRNLRVTAVGATRVIELPRAAFSELMNAEPAFKDLMLQLLCTKLRNSVNQSYEVLTMPLRVRLARQLLALGDSHGLREKTTTGERVRLNVKLSQEDLSRMLGATRQRINQLLREWELARLIAIESRRIVLLDLPSLQSLRA
jgi:CRP/FNR family transcriptional regulator, cyclic AMP receptor protein